MAYYTKLRSEPDLQAASDAFHALFRHGLSCDQPVFHPGSGIILWGIRNEFSEEQFRILREAALAEGDSEAYVSFIGDYQGGYREGNRLPADFEISDHLRFNLELYPPRDFGEDWWHIVEHAIYSPRGAWGVMTSLEWHAVAVGSANFRARLGVSPIFRDSLEGFLENWRDSRERLGGRTAWVPELLENVYGTAEADEIFARFRQPREAWRRNG